MKFILCSLLFVVGAGSVAFAGELDNERGVTNKDTMHGTLILRVDKRTKKAEYVATQQALPDKAHAKAYSKSASYKKVPVGKIRGELDRNGGSSSWYFYNGYNNGYNNGCYNNYCGQPGYNNGYNNGYYNGNYGYYSPYCNYYGQNYQPYYYYNQGYYNYYYYGNCNWGGNNCYQY